MDKQKGNMIFRNSLSFLVNLYVIAFHVSFHFLFIDTYISNIIGFCHLDISVVRQDAKFTNRSNSLSSKHVISCTLMSCCRLKINCSSFLKVILCTAHCSFCFVWTDFRERRSRLLYFHNIVKVMNVLY